MVLVSWMSTVIPLYQIITDFDTTHGHGSRCLKSYSDCSDLTQISSKKEKAIMHTARTLTATEHNYNQIEKVWPLIFAVRKFHRMLVGGRLTLLTDHKALLSVFGSTKCILMYSVSWLQRWATIILVYHFTVQY